MPIPIAEELLRYAGEHSDPPTPVATALMQETAVLREAGMQVTHEQGLLLGLLVGLMGAERVLEIGTFTGLSALHMASALPEGGRLVACDLSEEWTAIARRYWVDAGVAGRIELRLGPALETLDALAASGTEPFDLVFVDADKGNYVAYLDRAIPMLRGGGLLVADNTLWSGRVADETDESDHVAGIRRFNEEVAADPRVETLLLPVFDGLTLARRR